MLSYSDDERIKNRVYASLSRRRTEKQELNTKISLFFVTMFLATTIWMVGCTSTIRKRTDELPGKDRIVLDQLIVHTDFSIPRKHRLLDELTNLRQTIAYKLDLPTSDEPINIYLFENADSYHRYMAVHHPTFPSRRAFFLKSDTTLQVYAYWGERIAEDLRHEVSHGYLHSVIPNLPIWFDEGLAEYFEVPIGFHGRNQSHIDLLNRLYKTGQWKPDLSRLEEMIYADEMAQVDYAESWLWMHFLLEGGGGLPSFATNQVKQLRERGETGSLSRLLVESGITSENALAHLKALTKKPL
ncbi:DUF1570 domain-containing protein [Pirellulaceae bacterium]|jgi:hypothetical protein|nr:DUF1570 domain-containing protein [Pirellulaceae bacterium]MDC0296788.1 DUF1570 domain-containing protein [bacterium]